jgi:hypothetical protein
MKNLSEKVIEINHAIRKNFDKKTSRVFSIRMNDSLLYTLNKFSEANQVSKNQVLNAALYLFFLEDKVFEQIKNESEIIQE